MDYTMTFYCKDCLSLPEDKRLRQNQVQQQVLEKMNNRQLELVDFNRTENYSNSVGYDERANDNKTLIEIKLQLDKRDLKSRDAIFNKCFVAMRQNELQLRDYSGFEDKDNSGVQNIFVFERKKHAEAS
ncbi:hypothetical protein [Flavobacterium rhizosphaerae]|uniref:Uncharacterized protein n=1 Tax=Flavobacterium rhizosphaerae TaxID=3163298 RepID=A0ABW8Z046_9FLAO